MSSVRVSKWTFGSSFLAGDSLRTVDHGALAVGFIQKISSSLATRRHARLADDTLVELRACRKPTP